MTKLSLAVLTATVAGAVSSQAVLISGTGDAPNLGVYQTFETDPGEFSSHTWGTVTVTGIGATFSNSSDYAGQYNGRGAYHLQNGGDFLPSSFRLDFAGPVNAFAFNWGAADNTWTLTAYDSSNNLVDSAVISPTQSSNAGDWFGLSSANISYAILQSDLGASDWVFIDNVTHGEVGLATPDAGGTLALLSLGFGTIAAFGRRRR